MQSQFVCNFAYNFWKKLFFNWSIK